MPNWIPQIIAVLGGGAGITALLTAFLSWKKIRSEAKKTDVDAAAVLSDKVLEILDFNTGQMQEMQKSLDATRLVLRNTESALHEAEGQIYNLNRHLRDLNDLLRTHGINPPPLPLPTKNGHN